MKPLRKIALMAVGRGGDRYFPSLLGRRDRCEQDSGEDGEGTGLRTVRG